MNVTNELEEMPILNLNMTNTRRFEASRYLDTPETISAFLAEAMKANDPQIMMQALAEVAKARGVTEVAQKAGINRESMYKTFKGGAKARFETIMRLMNAVGVELTVAPLSCSRSGATALTDSAGSTETVKPKKAPRSRVGKVGAKVKAKQPGDRAKA